MLEKGWNSGLFTSVKSHVHQLLPFHLLMLPFVTCSTMIATLHKSNGLPLPFFVLMSLSGRYVASILEAVNPIIDFTIKGLASELLKAFNLTRIPQQEVD